MNRFIEVTVPYEQKGQKMSVSIELIRTFAATTDGGTGIDLNGAVLTVKESYTTIKELIVKEQKRSQRLSVTTHDGDGD